MKHDYSTNCVMKWLNYRGLRTVRINGEDDFYKFLSITNDGIYFRDSITDQEVNLKDVKACWWRRTGLTRRHFTNKLANENLVVNDLDLTRLINDKRNFLDDEARGLIDYIFYSIYKSSLINLGKPLFNLNRLIVLDIAKKHGLDVPNYSIVSNCSQLTGNETGSKKVTKSISNGIYSDIQNHRFYTYTELIEETFYEENKNINFFPSLITDLIEKKIEIRTFYIAGDFYSMAIFSQADEKTKIDFRKYSNNRIEPYKLPEEIETKLACIFKELDLNCGSVDLIIDKDDRFIFLEINPVGQFAMTSEPCNYNLHKIVANYLTYGTTTIN